MPTKIDRSNAPAAVPTSRISASPQATPVRDAPKGGAPAESFNAPSLPPSALTPQGAHVPITASPGSLWGDGPRRLDPAAFQRLPPAEQQARIAEWEARRAAAGERIHQRVGSLDHRWRYMRVRARCQALREYQARSQALDPRTRATVDAQLARAEAAQRRIDALEARAARLGKSRANDEARKKLAADLKTARADQSAAVKEATQTIDDKGLKVDRLAQTEGLIDPNAPKAGSGGSLLDTVMNWFSYTWQLFSCVTHVELSRTQDRQKKQEKQVEAERLLDERARNDMLRQRLNEELANRRVLAGAGAARTE